MASSGSTRPEITSSLGPECLLNDLEACHIVKIIFAALVASVPDAALRDLIDVRASGRVVPSDPKNYLGSTGKTRLEEILRATHALEDGMAIDLAKRLCRAVATRMHLPEPMNPRAGKAKESEEICPYDRKSLVISKIMRYITLDDFLLHRTSSDLPLPSIGNALPINTRLQSIADSQGRHVLLEWLRTVVLKEWDGKPYVPRCSAVSGALELLSWMCKSRIVVVDSGSAAIFWLTCS